MSINLSGTKDEEFLDKYNDIKKKIDILKLTEFEPSLNEIKNVNQIILNFIKTKKRKIYGGFGLNKLIINKDPKNQIYENEELSDIDFYSPEPINDLVQLCDKS